MALMVMSNLIISLTSFLFLYLFLSLIKFLHKVWWSPIRLQYLMGSQGIKGPPYKFMHGSTKEIIEMKEEALKSPMLDLSHNIFPRIQPHIYSWVKLYGKNCLSWYGPQAQLIVTDPDLGKEILNNKEGAYPKIKIQGYLKKLLGDGLVVSQGQKWYRTRKLANHAFHGESLKSMIPDMIESVEMMLERWRRREDKDMEVFEEFKVLTSEIISRTAFGSSYSEGENIFQMLLRLGGIFSRNDYKIRFPVIGKIFRTKDDLESDKMEQGIRDAVIKIINKREKQVLNGEMDNFGSDFLGLLVKAYHDDQNRRISIEDVVDECKTFYIAGQETTASLITWTVLLLAIHTDWQEKARNEMLELLGQQNPNSDSIARMKIMTTIINETLRLYPAADQLTRITERDIRLGKLNIPANTELVISTFALHQNPNIWGEDVHLFKPERFAEGVAKATNNNPAAFLPFGLGPRSCLGTNFAITETKIVLSMILQRYKFTLSPAYVHSPIQHLIICPQHGVQVILHPL